MLPRRRAGPCRSARLLLLCGPAGEIVRSPFSGGTHGTRHALRGPPSPRRTLFRGFPAGPGVRASPHPHGDADGQHAVLQHDAQPAAAPHRPAFLRAGDRMGQAADELAVHARADDRHLRQRPHGRDHDRQPGNDRGQVSASAVRGRHRALYHRGAGQTGIEFASGSRHRRVLSSRLQSGRQARRRMSPSGVHAHAAAMIAALRSALFVPGDSPQKLAKSLGSGADALILDLEDSVAAERKEAARTTTLGFLEDARKRRPRPLLMVRVNALETGLTDADLDAIVAGRPDAIMLPKAEGGAAVAHLDAKLAAREAIHGLPDGEIRIVALATETASALFVAGTYGGASGRLTGLSWGAEDLSADLGAETNRDAEGRFTEPFRFARNLCLAAAAAAKIQAIDTVFVDFRNPDGLKREAIEARRDGFSGKLAIHPAQVAVINEVFTPSPDAVAKAQAVLAAFAEHPGAGVVGIDGVMYDRPHLERAKLLLARAEAAA